MFFLKLRSRKCKLVEMLELERSFCTESHWKGAWIFAWWPVWFAERLFGRKEKEEYERRMKLKRAIEAGDKIPKQFKAEELTLRREMQLYGKEVRCLCLMGLFCLLLTRESVEC